MVSILVFPSKKQNPILPQIPIFGIKLGDCFVGKLLRQQGSTCPGTRCFVPISKILN